MKMFKKAFLYFVGAIFMAYDETTKALKEGQKRLVRTDGKIKA